MNCPFCNYTRTGVRNSRSAENGNAVRRRRVCSKCERRFTTFERVQMRLITVEKSGGAKETFDHDKLVRSIQIACRKRKVNEAEVDSIAHRVRSQLEKQGDRRVKSSAIGKLVIDHLKKVDEVAYVRFASVYHNFKNSADFRKFIAISK